MSTYTTPRQRPSVRNLTLTSSAGNTPTHRDGGGDIEVGDTVEVPGGMDGTVRFVGEVRGKKGFFVGVELSEQFAARGKNSGDAEGVRYFSTSVPGAGIFLPISRAVKKEPISPSGSIPPTPTTPGFSGARGEASPTPAVPTFSKSMIGRAPSPALRPNSRPSLPRPESPVRRSNMAPPRPPSATSRPSLPPISQNRSVTAPRFTASPAPGRSISKTPSKTALTSRTFRAPSRGGAGENEGDDIGQLRALLQEKNDKIRQLTVDFDNHRSDFRNTLDALEMASTETQRVYEAKVAELEAANESLAREQAEGMRGGGMRGLPGDQGDFEMVAKQLREVELVVQELEDGLEDARRGEAEARGEVEFLRGEVERLRAELRWEREQGEKALEQREREWRRNKSRVGGGGGGSGGGSGATNGVSRLSTGSAKFSEPSAAATTNTNTTAAAATTGAGATSTFADLSGISSSAARHHNYNDDHDGRPVTAYGPKSHPPPPAAEVGAGSGAADTTTNVESDKGHSAAAPVDEDKWCALCEQEGHDIMNCPNEDKL